MDLLSQSPPPLAARRRHTILVVDDEADVVKSVKDLLRLQYRVLGATSAAEGMKILGQEEVHVVMTDQRMSGVTGVEFLQSIRGEYPDAVRLLFTGYADIRAVIDAINQGNVFRYITKPWDPDELMSILRDAVERYDLIVERHQLLGQLEQSNRELERKRQLQDDFVKVASHELRSPLTVLSASTLLALRQPSLSPILARCLRRIDTSCGRLDRLVEQLIQQLSAEQFDRPLQLQQTDVGVLLREAADEVRPFVEARQQTLILDRSDDLGMLELEPGKIRDSLNSLLMNAIKFTADYGRITLSGRRTDVEVELHVSDTGVGIPADHLGLLFQPFFTGLDVQHHSSGHFEFCTRGIGLGLSVAREFVELHQGKIRVDSVVGQGTTFTITLPAPLRADPLA